MSLKMPYLGPTSALMDYAMPQQELPCPSSEDSTRCMAAALQSSASLTGQDVGFCAEAGCQGRQVHHRFV